MYHFLMRPFLGVSLYLLAATLAAQTVTFDQSAAGVAVRWPDERGRIWTAEFASDPARPLLTRIAAGGRTIVERARPVYWCSTGKRRGGWDQFFDFPPSHPDGTRSFIATLKPSGLEARKTSGRVEVDIAGFACGPFTGKIRYTFFPGTRLIQQEAVASTSEPDTAYYYDAGLEMMVESDRVAGAVMKSQVSYIDTAGKPQTVRVNAGPERVPVQARYRALAAHLPGGASIAAFPAPHQYFMPRDFTSNLGHLWHSAWGGRLSIGIRQLPDDNWRFYPWMNAPPGTEQHMGVFLLPSDAAPQAAIEDVIRFTHRDRFPALDGYKTVSTHWHYAYTVQAMKNGFDWTPPFKPVLKAMGVDASVIMDFHGDGHPADTGEVRISEVDAFYKACKAQSDRSFLLIPGEEANVHFGGHWAVMFPKPVRWIMNRRDEEKFETNDPKFGKVYRVKDAAELLDLIRKEDGWMYQTHPRTKGSMGFPDKIRDTAHFRDDRYFGAGWKAMNSDLSSPRLGDRSLKLLDDMSNWGMPKQLVGEVDVFQVDETHELYGHMNINYVRAAGLPAFDDYGRLLDSIGRGDFFVSTGEVLLPEAKVSGDASGITVNARVLWTFPLRHAAIVWGDGTKAHREVIPLTETGTFGDKRFTWRAAAPGWKWARVEVWDVAANGAFINPVWR
jgi:hypothetical protein